MSVSCMVTAFGADAGPVLSPQANGDANTRMGPCYVGIQFNTSGTEYERSPSTGSYNANQGPWLTGGSTGDYWVEFIRTAGAASFDGMSNSTRYNLGTTRSFGLTDAGGTNSITGYFRFWDAASGGSTLATTSTVSWSATDLSV